MKLSSKIITKAIKACLSKDALRGAMQHLYADKKRGQVVATNGHALVVWPAEFDDDDASCILTPDVIEMAHKFKLRKSPTLPDIELRDKSGTTHVRVKSSDGREYDTRHIHADKYPDYMAVIPKQDAEATVAVNLDVLQQLIDACPQSEQWGGRTVLLHFYGKTKAVKVTPTNAYDGIKVGLVMPVMQDRY